MPTLALPFEGHLWINDPSFGDIIKKAVPHAQIEIIEGSGHSVSRDRRDELLRLARTFLNWRTRGHFYFALTLLIAFNCF